MILKYVLKNFTRRKVRTLLMVLSLLVSTGLIVTMSATVETIRQSVVDLVADEAGRADFYVSRPDTSDDLFLPVEETAAAIVAADERVTAVYPRIEIVAETEATGRSNEIYLIGLESGNDDVGSVDVVAGNYELGDGRVAVNRWAAGELSLEVGDVFTVAYAPPIPREPGQAAAEGASSVRLQRQFTVGAIVDAADVAQAGGVLVEMSELQAWLGRPGQALQLAVTVTPDLYAANNAEAALLAVRDVALAVQQQLGAGFEFALYKPSALAAIAPVFLGLQAFINSLGLLSFGVVGLLVYTLVMTNVREQKRDMAVLRILGSSRRLLFALVLAEVLVIGLIGIGLGVILGQFLTTYALVPLLRQALAQEGLILRLAPRLSAAAILPPVISAFVILILSSLKPANEASRTRVMHAINPGVADNIQIEDLAQLRQRRPSGKMFLAGLILVLIFGLIIGFDALTAFGGEALAVVFAVVGLLGIVLGVSLLFFITTIPFERLVLFLMSLLFPRVTYFARRNVSRGLTLNTLISLLVLFSAVVPSFLGTDVRLQLANVESESRLNLGAPLRIQTVGFESWRQSFPAQQPPADLLFTPEQARRRLAVFPGVDRTAAVSYEFATRARDMVAVRDAPVKVVGLEGDLTQVLFPDLLTFTAGGPEVLRDLPADPEGVIISEGLAAYLGVEPGQQIELQGAGLDNFSTARVVAIARSIPGLDNVGRSQTAAQEDSTVLVAMDHFRRLVTELDGVPPGSGAPLLGKVFATLQPEADAIIVGQELVETPVGEVRFWADTVARRVEENRSESILLTTLLLALTGISFTTAIFAVFAVIYVSVYARRTEIGMLKAVGMTRRELNGMLIVESIAMTLGSALAGITAGAGIGYLNRYVNDALAEQPTVFAFDYVVIPGIIIMVVVASMLGAALSARRIIRKPAVEILRME